MRKKRLRGRDHFEPSMKGENLKRLEFYQQVNRDSNFLPDRYIIIAKLRCSSHCLEIEKGRHRNIPREARLCKMCPDNIIEDEIHFLVGCKTYNKVKTDHNINIDNAVELINCTDQQNLAQYLYGAFNLRKDTLG